MIADLISKLRIYVNYIVIERAKEQTIAHQNVIKSLRVAFELVGIPFTLWQCFD